ncbi:MAG: hypothetical protein KIS76_05990 [Pyrinomonadaceae bacterium]|nr:hypothetical protein [Pyrinomonadaceae bacterium]
MFAKIALGLGIAGILIGGLVLIISLILPLATDGRTSWEEALIGIIPGAVVLIFSFLIAAVGAVLLFMNRKKKS